MLEYIDLLDLLKQHGWSTYRLQKEKLISNGTIMQIRAKKPITTTTIETICRLCHCQPGDLLQYKEEQE